MSINILEMAKLLYLAAERNDGEIAIPYTPGNIAAAIGTTMREWYAQGESEEALDGTDKQTLDSALMWLGKKGYARVERGVTLRIKITNPRPSQTSNAPWEEEEALPQHPQLRKSYSNIVAGWRRRIVDCLLDNKGKLDLQGKQIAKAFGIDMGYTPMIPGHLTDKQAFVEALESLLQEESLCGAFGDPTLSPSATLIVAFVGPKGLDDRQRSFLDKIDKALAAPVA